MREWIIGAALAGAAMAAQPALAAANLECIDAGYSAEQEKIFDAYYAGFTIASLDSEESDGSNALVDPVASRAASCALEHGWSQDAIFNAIVFRMSVMLAAALEVKTPLTSEQMSSLEAALAKADQARLRAILGPGIEASLKGQPDPEMSDDDALYLGLLVIGAGLPMEQTYSEYAGALLGARMMAEMAAEKFEQS